MFEDFKWTLMVNWLNGDDIAYNEKDVAVLANVLAGQVVKVSQHTSKGQK